jgi:hypothetical protein
MSFMRAIAAAARRPERSFAPSRLCRGSVRRRSADSAGGMDMQSRLRIVVFASAALGLAAGCASYRPAPLDVDRPLRSTDAPPKPLTFDAAVRFAVEHNPDLLALRERAGAVNVDLPREPVEVGAGADSDHRFEAGLSFDALSLLGLGRRPAELALACARRSEAWLAHHARAREIAGEIAEAFAVERALAALADPDVAIDPSVYVRAGLETAVADSAATATKADWTAEQAVRTADRRANRAALARLLGLASADAIVMTTQPDPWPEITTPSPAALIAARADVQRSIGQFEVADRELRRAVAAQYPTLLLEPSVAADPTTFFGAARLVIPVGAASEVRAMESAREAARHDVEGVILDAMREADESRARHDAAQVRLSAAVQRLSASSALFSASRTRIQVASGSVIESVFAADAVVSAATSVREASVEAARARVRAARSSGWPAPNP